jgi:hypothetical protein
MSTYEYKNGNVKVFVETVSLDTEGTMTLSYRELITVGVGKNQEVHEGATRQYRRRERGSPEPKWDIMNAGGWTPIDSGLVDVEVRRTWVSHNIPIKKSDKAGKVKKEYVDITNYARWKERMKWAREELN